MVKIQVVEGNMPIVIFGNSVKCNHASSLMWILIGTVFFLVLLISYHRNGRAILADSLEMALRSLLL